MLLEEELTNATTDTEKVEVGRRLLPLFTEKSALKNPLALQVLRAEIGVNPQIIKDFNGFIGLLTHYIPEPSLARNYFLNQLENSVSLTPDQLKHISSMRVSSEGKKEENDSAPMTFVINRLGELNREEKVKATLWLLGISNEKPKTILDIEARFDGHLDSLPKAVAISTEDEKSVLFQRLLLGAEGIVDLEAVNIDQLEKAEAEQQEFIRVFSKNLLPDSMPRAEVFRGIFATIIESSDPSHSSRILIKLINKFTELQIKGQTLPPEEIVAIGLNELGVVGKKVAQSLAELEWVPDSYKKTLRKSQSEGEVVPKRALMVFAENMGLLDEGAPIRIVAFDELIGAASNKQACLLTIEVNDENVGLPKGRHQVVGKFKRPSAQKIENLNHDLRVMRNITDSLAQQGYIGTLPKDFSAQISDAVKRELDFAKEKQFSEEIKADLERRNLRRRHKVKVPTIFFASDDLLLESKAEGISLRDYYDLKENPNYPLVLFRFGMEKTFSSEINRTLLEEGLAELISTGNIHADLHPGNIFIDPESNLTLIDLGMHERITTEQRLDTVSLVAGLITGNETFVKRVLTNLDWNIGDVNLNLRRLDLAENTSQLLKAIQRSGTRPPKILSSIILATSKLTNYAAGFSNSELFRILAGSVNARELPQVVLRLIQSGGRELMR